MRPRRCGRLQQLRALGLGLLFLLLAVAVAAASSTLESIFGGVQFTKGAANVIERAAELAKEKKNAQLSPLHVAACLFDEETVRGYGVRDGQRAAFLPSMQSNSIQPNPSTTRVEMGQRWPGARILTVDPTQPQPHSHAFIHRKPRAGWEASWWRRPTCPSWRSGGA